MKIALTLSGGGLRAAYFHLGLLAKLANSGLLKNVECISTVSGGSIIGSIYAIRLRQEIIKLNKEKQPLTDSTYIKVVQKVSKDLGTITDANFRLTRLSLLEKNIKKNIKKSSKEKNFKKHFAGLEQLKIFQDDNGRPLKMSDLRISFSDYKFPNIILNSTCLNTGNTWIFTPYNTGFSNESNNNFRRVMDTECNPSKLYTYEELEEDITVASAVYASSAFPGLKPLKVKFRDSTTLSELTIADGGIIDNLGIDTLAHEKWDHIIVSDASKYLLNEYPKKYNLIQFISRANTIALENLRVSVTRRLSEPKPNKVTIVSIVEGIKDQKSTIFSPDEIELLSNLRTDLDYFSLVERDSLSLVAYEKTHEQINSCVILKNFSKDLDYEWPFENIKVYKSEKSKRYKVHLQAGQHRMFKYIWHICYSLKLEHLLLFMKKVAINALLSIFGILILFLIFLSDINKITYSWGIPSLFVTTWLVYITRISYKPFFYYLKVSLLWWISLGDLFYCNRFKYRDYEKDKEQEKLYIENQVLIKFIKIKKLITNHKVLSLLVPIFWLLMITITKDFDNNLSSFFYFLPILLLFFVLISERKCKNITIELMMDLFLVIYNCTCLAGVLAYY
ncbi:patatin-like phospholipase family protein [Priestia megaterium]|uniref:patatin-like phospholipase family protein n=1 Tax=Priestia megaterium TaxID=1404 RepID=UPI003BA2B5CD